MIDPKKPENTTPNDDGHIEEKKTETGDDTPKTEVTEEKVLTPKEIETLQKKAADFDGLIEKQRLSKLQKKEETPKSDDEVVKKLEEMSAKIESFEKEKTESNLSEAVKEFSKEIPWAVADEYFDKISSNFSGEGLKTKEEIVSKLKSLTISLFPDKYMEDKEREIKAKALVDATKINAGSSGASSNNEMGKGTEAIDPLAKLKERFNSTLPRGYSAIKK